MILFQPPRGKMKTNQLVEIPFADWQTLLDLYRHKRVNPSGWNCIKNYINWLTKDPTLDVVKFYSLNGDWSDGTFIIQDDISVMFNTLAENHDRLLEALNCITDLTQFKNVSYICLCDFAHCFKDTVNKYMEPTGIKIDTNAVWLHIDRQTALNLNVESPPGTCLKPLDPSHINTVNNLWAYKYPGSEKFIGRLIHFNVTFGLFDANDELLGWCLQLPRGSLGLLQVRDEHKRKGYGSLIVRGMSRKLAEMGIEVTTSAVDTNVASRRMFQKIGFKEVDSIHWVCRPMNGLGS